MMISQPFSSFKNKNLYGCHRVPSRRSPRAALRHGGQLRDLILERPPDVLHLRNPPLQPRTQLGDLRLEQRPRLDPSHVDHPSHLVHHPFNQAHAQRLHQQVLHAVHAQFRLGRDVVQRNLAAIRRELEHDLEQRGDRDLLTQASFVSHQRGLRVQAGRVRLAQRVVGVQVAVVERGEDLEEPCELGSVQGSHDGMRDEFREVV
mmetsp:Transcript_2510/g.11364  ORF Transcript_2510/g.11364 Transcript_2510/m.11364 type:complete len:204 (+) Transcript_2510:1866-2477(+)